MLADTYVNEMSVSEHAVRIYSDDDEVDLGFYFFSGECVRQYPERLSSLVYTEAEFPTDWRVGSFEAPFKVELKLEVPKGQGTQHQKHITDNANFRP